MPGLDQEMFDKIANVENYNDPERLGLLNTISQLLFGKPVDKLNDFASGLMKVMGQYLMNSYGDLVGLSDAGQNFASMHQAVARTGNFRPMDQNGKFMSGSIQGPGAVTLGITRSLSDMVKKMYDPEDINTDYITGGVSQLTTSQAVGQLIRERGGIRDGEYIHMQDVKPGAKGAEEALQKAIDKGLDENDPSVKEMAKAVAATKAQDEVIRWGEKDADDRLKKDLDDAKSKRKQAEKDFKEGKIEQQELDKAKEQEEMMEKRREGGKEMRESVKEFNEAQDEVEALQKRADAGEDVTKELIVAEAKRDDARIKMQDKARSVASENKKYLLQEKVAGIDMSELDLDDVSQDIIDAVRKGKVEAGGLTRGIKDEIKESLKNSKRNIKDLTEIFGTDNFEELKHAADQLSMGSLVDSKNVANVAKRIRTAKAEAERTGRSVKEVLEEQAAIASTIELMTGYKPGAATVERIQRQREQADRNIETGATTLTREEQDAKLIDAESILQRENQEIFNSHYLMKKLENSEDPQARAAKAEYDALEKQLEEAKTPAERDAIKQKMLDISRGIFGYNMTTSEQVSRQANQEDNAYQEEYKQKMKDQITTQEDANYYKNNIKNSPILREQYEKRYGENWEQVAEAEYGQIAKTYGNQYDKFEADRKAGANQRKDLESTLTDENRELVHAKEREIEDLKEQYKFATDPHEKARLKDEIEHAEEVLDQLGGEEYAKKRQEIEKETDEELEAYADTLRKGDFTEEEISEAVEARRKVIENSRSTDTTKTIALDTVKDVSQQSRSAASTESMENKAKAKAGYRDQFEKELETDREETYTKKFMESIIKSFATDGAHVTEKTALASYMKEHIGDSVEYDPETGNAVVDTDKLNDEKEEGIAAIKVNASDEEKQKYASNAKVREMLGVETEEEALELLNDPAKLQDRLMELSDNNKRYVTKMGEGDGEAIVLVDRPKMDEMIDSQEKDQAKIQDHLKFFKGTNLDNIDVGIDGVRKIEVGGKEETDPRAIDEWIAGQAQGGTEVRKNLEELAKSEDKATAERASKILELADEESEIDLFNGGAFKTMGEMKDVMGKKFDKKWEDLDENQKALYGSESAYNLARAQAKQKNYALDKAVEDDEETIIKIAETLGIKNAKGKKWKGDVSELSADDQRRIAVEYGMRNKDWYTDEWNKLDWMNSEEGLNAHKDKSGKIKFSGVAGDDKEEFTIDASEYHTSGRLRRNMENQGTAPGQDKEGAGGGEGGGLIGVIKLIYEGIQYLCSCISPSGSLKVTNND